MLDGTQSGCVNHPGIEATYRCKCCSKPVCGGCVVVSTRGNFCSEVCQKKFEGFAERAEKLEPRKSWSLRLKRLAGKLVLWAIALLVLGAVASKFSIPILSDIVYRVRDFIGI